MCTAWAAACGALLPAGTGVFIDVAAHGQYSRPLSGGSLQRQPPIGRLPRPIRNSDQPRPDARFHAPHWLTCDLPETPYHCSWRSISATPLLVHLTEITVVNQVWASDITNIPLTQWLPLPGGNRGYVLQELAPLEAPEQT